MTEQNEIVRAVEPMELLRMATESGADVDKLEKLMALQERWQANKARAAFFSALADFQSECPDLRKTKQVAFKDVKYNYAPLADIARQIKILCKKHGLAYRWQFDDKDTISVTCLVTHVEGHTEATTMSATADTTGSKNPIQARGSAIEYLKRYTLIGALGLSTADSDIDARMPEMDVDKLHKVYMDIYNQITPKDKSFIVPGNPDNWSERTPDLYLKAIGKAREILNKLP
jgi:hypothetical protein